MSDMVAIPRDPLLSVLRQHRAEKGELQLTVVDRDAVRRLDALIATVEKARERQAPLYTQAQPDAAVRAERCRADDIIRAATSLMRRHNSYSIAEDDSQAWQQLADACLRFRARDEKGTGQ